MLGSVKAMLIGAAVRLCRRRRSEEQAGQPSCHDSLGPTGEAIDGPHRSAVRPGAMTRVFLGHHSQVACARAFVRAAVGPVSVVDEAVLLVSELCTNALLHTASGDGGMFEVAVYLVLQPDFVIYSLGLC